MRKHPSSMMAVLAILMLILAACTSDGGESPSEAAESQPATSDGSEPSASEAPTGLAACGDPESGDAWLIGGVTDVGQLEDKSFNEGGWCGTISGATSVGGSAEVIVTEDPADYAANMQTFIDQGYQIIVTYGFALGNATAIAAKENPEVWFIGLDQPVCVDENGDPDPTFTCAGDAAELLPNYQGLIFTESQAGYLAGIVAGTITETNVIGTIGGIESIPAVKLYIGGYHNGALSVNPDVEVLISYVSEDITTAFNDPTTGASLAEQMIGQDADVIFQVAGLSGQGALEAACDADIYGIGVDVDQALALPTRDVHRHQRREEARQRDRRGDPARGRRGAPSAAASFSTRLPIRPRSASRSSTTSRTCSRLSCRLLSTTRRRRWPPASSILVRAKEHARTLSIRTRTSAQVRLSRR